VRNCGTAVRCFNGGILQNVIWTFTANTADITWDQDYFQGALLRVTGRDAGGANDVLQLTDSADVNVFTVDTDGNADASGNVQVGGQAYSTANALVDAASIATDCDLGNVHTVTIAGNRTLANPTNLQAGATYLWEITQDGTGTRTLAYGAAFTWPGGTAPVLTTTPGAVDVISAVCFDGSTLRCTFNLAFA
jgi:hypothetical protein